MDIVFMGSPEFAVPSLERLAKAFSVVGVVTQPDRRRGRGQKLRPTPVKRTAQELGIRVYQPESVSDQAFIDRIQEVAPDFIIVVAFGQLIPRELIDLPRLGSINLHASLLPRYRGASPIHRAIIDGQEETGLTTMFLSEELDAGDIIFQERMTIGREETVGSLHDRMSQRGAELLVKTINMVGASRHPRRKQNPEQATYAPRIGRDDARIDWGERAERIRNLIRGTNPWPGAFAFYGDRRLKVFCVEHMEPGTSLDVDPRAAEPGVVLGFTSRDEAIIRTGDKNHLVLKEVQPENSSRMNGGDFTRGYRVQAGDKLVSTGEKTD